MACDHCCARCERNRSDETRDRISHGCLRLTVNHRPIAGRTAVAIGSFESWRKSRFHRPSVGQRSAAGTRQWRWRIVMVSGSRKCHQNIIRTLPAWLNCSSPTYLWHLMLMVIYAKLSDGHEPDELILTVWKLVWQFIVNQPIFTNRKAICDQWLTALPFSFFSKI